MSVCAFWLSNCLLFLYYLRKEPNLAPATTDYQTHFQDLVNEIFVFVIRDAERRIDRVLEAALLEHEALPGFEDVAFEDEWASTRFVKKLTGRAKKGSIRSSTSAMSLFSDAGGSSGASVVVAGDTASPPRAGPTSAASASAARIVSASTIPVHEATPRSITALLSSTLFVLQIYEIPPAIIVQAFSQLFYWIACEVFNRLLNQVRSGRQSYLSSSCSDPLVGNSASTCVARARCRSVSTHRILRTGLARTGSPPRWSRCTSRR